MQPLCYVITTSFAIWHYATSNVDINISVPTNVLKNNSWMRVVRTHPLNLPKRQDLNDLLPVMQAEKVSKVLRQIIDEELDLQQIQSLLDEANFRHQDYNHAAQLNKIAQGMTKKLELVKKALSANAKEILDSYKINPYDVQVFKRYRECCSFDKRFLRHDPMFGAKINSTETCEIVQRGLSPFAFHPRNGLLKVFENNSRNQNSLFKWQYFISSEGLHVEYPAHKPDLKNFTECTKMANERHRDIYMKVALPFKKRVIILVDRGNVMSNTQIETAKCVAKALIRSLDDEDEAMTLLVGEEVTYPARLKCKDEKFFKATVEIKNHLCRFVDNARKSSGHTNHSLGFSEAFKLLKEVDSADKIKPLILYLSRGMFAQLTDGTSVMAAIAEWNLKLSNRVQINTFALLDAGKAVMWETTFLRDVAAQNFHQYAQSFPAALLKVVKSQLKPPEGKMILVNSSNFNCIGLKEIYEALKPADHRLVELSEKNLIQFNYSITIPPGECTTISFGRPIVHDDHFLGIVGLDVCLRHFASSLVYYESADSTAYGFLIDGPRQTWLHPRLSSGTKETTFPIDIDAVEKDFPTQTVSNNENNNGIEVSSVFYAYEAGDSSNDTRNSLTRYHWRRIQNTNLILVLKFNRMTESVSTSEKLNRKTMLTNFMTYHRIDLSINKDMRVCVQGRTLFNTERCGLYLAPKCFEKSYERILIDEDLRTAQGYWAYITDHTKLITNPGLKSEKIRHDIAEWANIIGHWCQPHERTPSNRIRNGDTNNKPVIRKFLATTDGIVVTYPAFYLRQDYDPSVQEWFRRATRRVGEVVLSPPYLDVSGYVVPMSVALTSRRGDGIVAVASLHWPMGLLYARVKEAAFGRYADVGAVAATAASDVLAKITSNDDCFLMDSGGYVVAHRSGLAVDGIGASAVDGLGPHAFEQMHVTHKEATIATELLQQKAFMQKFLCRDVASQAIQRFYLINESFNGVLRSNDPCPRYQIILVPHTNVFMVVVNRSCSRPSAFCPCSVLDRKCLNCHRSEPLECECPCQCPNKGAYCGDDSEVDTSRHPLCDNVDYDSSFPLLPENSFKIPFKAPPTCYVANCAERDTEISCLKTVGCEWFDDSKTPAEKPFCWPVSKHYSGIFGLATYSFGGVDSRDGGLFANMASSPNVQSTPVGPVAGGIMTAFVLLTLAVLWYRRKVSLLVEASRRRRRRYDANGSGSRLNADVDDEDEFEFDGGAGSGGGNTGPAPADIRDAQQGACLLLASFERDNMTSTGPPIVRPRPPWRRGPLTESSDPGYSTMTGGNCDESEQATTIVDQVAIGRSRPIDGPSGTPSALASASSSDDLSTTLTNADADKTMSDKSGDLTLNETSDLRVSPKAGESEKSRHESDTMALEGQTVLNNKRCHTITTTAIVHAVDV